MAYQHKPNSGTLFPNDRKEKETHPDRKGSALIDGKEYWVSGWDNDGGRVSLAFSPKEAAQGGAQKEHKQEPKKWEKKTVDESDGSDIPF